MRQRPTVLILAKEVDESVDMQSGELGGNTELQTGPKQSSWDMNLTRQHANGS